MKNGKTVNTVIYELHLYKNKMEYLIKFVIWVISWIGSAYVLRNAQTGVGSAYFVLSLSMLMEFVPIVTGSEKKAVSRVVHTLLCFSILAVLIISVGMLLSSEYGQWCHKAMFCVSSLVLGYMMFDCFLLWSCDFPSNTTTESENTADNEEVLAFLNRALKGNLGDIEVNKNV